MPTAALVIDASPIAELVRRLEAVDGDRREALDGIGGAWVSSTLGRFDSGTAPGGTRWKPSLRARQTGGQTLVEHGTLKNSNTYQVVGDDTVEVGTNVPYAAAHQFGVTINPKSGGRLRFKLPSGQWVSPKSVTLPARPFLGADDDDYLTFGEILRDLIAGRTGAAS